MAMNLRRLSNEVLNGKRINVEMNFSLFPANVAHQQMKWLGGQIQRLCSEGRIHGRDGGEPDGIDANPLMRCQ